MNRRDLLKRGIRLAAAAPVVGLLGQSAFAAPPAPKPLPPVTGLVMHTPEPRTLAYLLEHFADNDNGNITPDDVRDFIVGVDWGARQWEGQIVTVDGKRAEVTVNSSAHYSVDRDGKVERHNI